MTILITGATGFVGNALCHHLAALGISVRAAVRDTAATLPAGTEAVVVGNISGATDWKAALAGVDVVIHLAARAHIIKETESDPLAVFRAVNLDGTLTLFRAAQAARVRRFVLVSSLGVLGQSTPAAPFDANSPVQPHNAYSQSKADGEQAVLAARPDGVTEVVIVRPPLVYGPANGGNFLRLLQIVSKGVPLPLGCADALRDMIFVDNLVDALWTCATHPRAADQTYVVCDGAPVSTAGLIKAIALAMKGRALLLPVPTAWLALAGRLLGRGDDVARLLTPLRVDDSKIRSELDWKPPVPMPEGIVRTVAWFRGR